MVAFYIVGYSIIALLVIASIALPIISYILFKKGNQLEEEYEKENNITKEEY